MPVFSYFEMDAPRHVKLTTSAGDHTRYVRIMAAAAPYIQNGKQAGTPKPTWMSPELNAQVRLIAHIWWKLNGVIPGRR